ncbi:MAG: PTS sugar transporter subunit IIB [Elusimicrobiota bacterium]|nr:PTS sugar transporter subunit IIB [Endomicrobiia bacterium]MCX7910663.1 PTS sugar transporter subunit IIB [Endomicrobiia bacterium]MDW8164981.1 PTS sugar transporter subunit IIB [Elusimicrobiota bacterium]
MSYIIRIDDRLLHGQVIEGWIKPLKIEKLVVSSDIVYCDSLQKNLYLISVPENIELECLSLELTAEKISAGKFDKIKTLVLISSLKDLYELVLKIRKIFPDYKLPPVNVGGIRHTEGRVQIYKALFLSLEEIQIIKKLEQLGITLEYYVLPEDPRVLINEKISQIEEIIERKLGYG